MAISTFTLRSVTSVIIFILLLISSSIRSAGADDCQTAEINISNLTRQIYSDKNLWESKKLRLADVVITIDSQSATAALDEEKATLIIEIKQLERKISDLEAQKASAEEFKQTNCK